jgi:hypothetical protein
MSIGVKRLARTVAAEIRGHIIAATGGEPTFYGPHKIFVIGSGRSGTHWLGYILEAFPETHVTVEKPPIFPWVVEMAQRPGTEDRLFPQLAGRYRAEHRAVLPKHYVDKSHPNLWLAERLADEFPEARFVAIWRSLEGTVASMLKHEGVRHWVEVWDRSGGTNRFLGVTRELIPAYRNMSKTARCAVRVIAHAAEIDRLTKVLGQRLHVVAYDGLHRDPDVEIERLAAFLGLPVPSSVPTPDAGSRWKWRTQLSDADLADIREVAALMGAEHLLDAQAA